MVGDLVGRTDGKLEGIVLGANKKNKKKLHFFSKNIILFQEWLKKKIKNFSYADDLV